MRQRIFIVDFIDYADELLHWAGYLFKKIKIHPLLTLCACNVVYGASCQVFQQHLLKNDF